MSDADLRLVCTQEGIDVDGTKVDVQDSLHVHLFGPPRTLTKLVQTACDMEFASALLIATEGDDGAVEHSPAGAWLASGLRCSLGRQVTVRTFLCRTVPSERQVVKLCSPYLG